MATETLREQQGQLLSSPELLRSRLRKPALLELAGQGKARFFLQFGGQAAGYIEELREVYRSFPLIHPLIQSADQLLQGEMRHPEAIRSGLFSQGLSPLEWIQKAETTPPPAYLSRSSISQSLIFLTQIAHFAVLTHYGADERTVLRYTSGTTGHSQGIMSAVLIALGHSGEKFQETFLKFLKYFFWQSIRMQQSCPEIDLPADLILRSRELGFGTPSPMASLVGLDSKELSLPPSVTLSLKNGWKRLVLAGPAERLFEVAFELKKSGKKITWEFLPVSGPYHSPHMVEGLKLFRKDLERINWGVLQGRDLKIPVYATEDGRDLRKSRDLTEDLLQMQFLKGVDWNRATAQATGQKGITHLLDFGPGEIASTLTFLNREGEGIVVIPCATRKGRDLFFQTQVDQVPFEKRVWEDFAPRILKGEKKSIVNGYSRLTGRPPIFGGGMTPTSVEPDIVVAALNSGYLIEWAGGGQVTEEILRKRLDQLVSQLKPGQGIIFNALYLDPYLWNLHYPLLPKLKREGYPIEGVTISAGIPTREKAAEILRTFNENGIWCNSFKPGSDQQIRSVLEIADDHRELTLIMQIEGGKAGGHHSWEDLYGLLERNYASIRRRKNIVLAVGGGIGFEEEASRYLLGNWHQSGKIMPVDAVILGTRLMACREAKTSPQVKKLLVEVAGTTEWVGKGKFEAGVTSGQSQLGADVHYADNRMSRVAQQIDEWSTQGEEAIASQKDLIIAAVNQTSKPYFGELSEMTYAEALSRMIDRMAPGKIPDHIPHDGPWYDVTFRRRAFEFFRRTAARFNVNRGLDLSKPSVLDEPQLFLNQFLKIYPEANETILHQEDVDYFLSLCRLPGKPVNFLPVVDKDLRRWFKGDSLWQAHDPRYPAESVFTIPGPEAVRGIRKVDEPVSEIFGNFSRHLIQELEKRNRIFEEEKREIPTGIERIVSQSGSQVEWIIQETANLPRGEEWLRLLAQEGKGPIQRFLKSRWILEESVRRPHYWSRLLAPHSGLRITFKIAGGEIQSLNVPGIELLKTLRATLVHQTPDGKKHRFQLNYQEQPESGVAPIVLKNNRKAIQTLYQSVWLGKRISSRSLGLWEPRRETVVVSPESISTPISLFWVPITEILFQKELDVDFLKLVHLSHEFHSSDRPIAVGEKLEAWVKLHSISNEKSGQVIVLQGALVRGDQPVVHLESRFFVREPGGSREPVFESFFEQKGEILINRAVATRLKSKAWFRPLKGWTGEGIASYSVQVHETRGEKKDFEVQGFFERNGKKIGTISFRELGSTLLKNPVLYFLEKQTQKKRGEIPQTDGFTFEEELIGPSSNEPYAIVSRDFNPIHTDPRFVTLADLPTGGREGPTVVHGMWTYSTVCAALERRLGCRVVRWRAEFAGIVYPQSRLTVRATHVANEAGLRLFEVAVEEEGRPVLRGRASVEQPKTAYLFTGQGSQTTGMGMQSYQNSQAAREIWDRADRFCRNQFGFSILQVVRENPKELLIDGEKLSHPKGVLHLTQFTQVGLTVLALAQMAEIREAGIYQEKSLFAGHSLGEYAALSATGILPLEKVIRTVYQRGLTMQHFVPRDEAGRSPYGMVVVRPKPLGWSEQDLERRMQGPAFAKAMAGRELYLVNYNMEGSQYAVTGRLEFLRDLKKEIDAIEKLKRIEKPCCIFLEGVDVPFHSPLLLPGVTAFRKTLEEAIPETIDPKLLVHRYIPNLNAALFRLDRDYVQSIFDLTKSSILETVLSNWKKWERDARLARILLIELLAYQFASPVQWIATQKQILSKAESVQRIIELGPSPVLANMMRGTIERERLARPPQAYHLEADRAKIFYQEVREIEKKPAPISPQPVSVAAQPMLASVPVPPDRPYNVEAGLRLLLALKLNIRPEEIRENESLELLSGGNSARRNELLTDLGGEFQISSLEEGHQLPFSKLVKTIEERSRYEGPGPLLQRIIEKSIREKLPLTRSEIESYLSEERCLPPGHLKRVLAYLPHAVRSGNSVRLGPLSPIGLENRLADRREALDWLSKAADQYGQENGIQIPHRSQMQGAVAGGTNPPSSEELKKYFGEKGLFARWAEELSELSGPQTHPVRHEESIEELKSLQDYQAEFGKNVEKIIQSQFDPEKIVSFTSWWNWGKRDFVARFWGFLREGGWFTPAEEDSFVNRATPELIQTGNYLATVAERRRQQKLAEQVRGLTKRIRNQKGVFVRFHSDSRSPQVEVSEAGEIVYQEKRRRQSPLTNFLESEPEKEFSFSGRTAIVTGGSPGSIAWEMIKLFLQGGGRVIATTSSYGPERIQEFRKLYQQFGASGSELHLVPFSQGSRRDIEALLSWCFKRWVPDVLLPFGAISETATLSLMNADQGTAALRVLLQGVEWLIGGLAREMKNGNILSRKTTVLLPLSPNHGAFGGDGSYADAKLALESLFAKWHSEQADWGRFINLIGATIGWVRGTGLMAANNLLAASLESSFQVRTFSPDEMGWLLASLLQPSLSNRLAQGPLRVSFTGGFEKIPDLSKVARETRARLEEESALIKWQRREEEEEKKALWGETEDRSTPSPKSPIRSDFPKIPDREFSKKGIDPREVVVVVGYGEVSPFGTSRPRWEMEETGELSMASAIEIAWLMGLIQYEDGKIPGKPVGWVDTRSGKPVADDQVFEKYRREIFSGTGIRFADPSVQNFDPRSTTVFSDVVTDRGLSFTVESKGMGEEYLKQYPGARLEPAESGSWRVTLPKGSLVKIPRRASLSRWVAGQVPTGWDPVRFGLPKEMVAEIDRTALFNLISSAQAFVSAGLAPEELYQFLSPTRVGNSQGGGMGGMVALSRMYHDHREDKTRQGDALQETLINVGPAWVTQSFVGSYGPTVHPVGACATALVSLSIALDLVGQDRADFVVSGGFDDYSEEGVIGFQDMAATCETEKMLRRGISPRGMSRPNDSRRAGFVESQGGGTLLLARLDRAIEMGLPIYAVVAYSGTFSDGIHSSIPAPGLGLLGLAQNGKEEAPLARALDRFGLSVDDIRVVSKHDTSTEANDPNENKLHDLIQRKLGRSEGNPLFVHSQKALLGHAKGGAGAWQAIAAIQMMLSGKIPGNPNLEDVDPKMRPYSTLLFSDQTIELGEREIRAVLMTSLGFGHVGAATLFLHPDLALEHLSPEVFQKYKAKRKERERSHLQKSQKILLGKSPLYERRRERPAEAAEIRTLLGEEAS